MTHFFPVMTGCALTGSAAGYFTGYSTPLTGAFYGATHFLSSRAIAQCNQWMFGKLDSNSAEMKSARIASTIIGGAIAAYFSCTTLSMSLSYTSIAVLETSLLLFSLFLGAVLTYKRGDQGETR